MLARLLLSGLLAAPSLAAQAQFATVPVGPANSFGLTSSHLNGISPDGSVAVGSISDPVRGTVPITWTPAGGTVPLPVPAGPTTPSYASRISADLGTIVGVRGTGNSFALVSPLRWDDGAAPIDLTLPGGFEFTLPVFVDPEGRFVLGIDERLGVPFARQGLLWDETGALVTSFPSDILCGSAAPDGSYFFAAQAGSSVRLLLDGTVQPYSFPLPPEYDSGVATHANLTGTVIGGVANVPFVRDDVFLYDGTAQTFLFAPGLPQNGPAPHRLSLLTPGLELGVVTFPGASARPALWIPTLGTADMITYAEELGADPGPLAAPGTLLTATGVSEDGTKIVGSSFAGGVQRGWQLSLPAGWWDVVGDAYCEPAVANSTGEPSRTMAFGSDEIAAGMLRLETHRLPPGAFGLYAVAPSTGHVTPPGSAGPLCLGGAIGRFDGPGQILAASPRGRVRLGVDLANLPGPNGPRTAAPGETWHFQFWHRDSLGSTSSNFSNAVTVVAR